MQKLQHLNINTLGIVWTRTPSNYESYSDVDAAMAIINPDGSASLYNPGELTRSPERVRVITCTRSGSSLAAAAARRG